VAPPLSRGMFDTYLVLFRIIDFISEIDFKLKIEFGAFHFRTDFWI
jgi:hypothetical protein